MKQRVVRIDKDDKSSATNKPTSKQQTRRWKASCHTAGAFCDLRQFLLQKGHPTQSLSHRKYTHGFMDTSPTVALACSGQSLTNKYM